MLNFLLLPFVRLLLLPSVRLVLVLWMTAAAACLGSSPARGFLGVTDQLTRQLEHVQPQAKLRVNVILKRQPDLQAIHHQASAIAEPRARRQEVWTRVEAHAREARATLESLIDELEVAGQIHGRRPLIGAGGVNLWATRAAIDELATLPAVRSIDWDEDRPAAAVCDALAAAPDAPLAPASIAWHVDRVRAPEMWAQGYTGAGILIGVIDSGVNYNHLDLRDHLWDGGVEFPHHGYDFVDDDDDPIDEGHVNGHGTRAAGICCGDGTAGTQTGIAPDASLMVLRASGATTAESFFWAAEDFAIAHGCDVLTASISWKFNLDPDYATWRAQEDLLLLADVAHSNSAGNQHNNPCCPEPYNVSTPGNTPPPWLHPDQILRDGVSGVLAVGNTDDEDEISFTSSRGPASWQDIPEYGDYPWEPDGDPMGLLKPDVVAPGLGTTSTAWDDTAGYAPFGGTSAAAPNVGGALCLLRQAHPVLGVAQLARIIQEGAVDLGAAGKDNVYGAGRIDIFASHVLSLIQPPTDLVAADTPADGGGSIDLSWTLSSDDGGGNGLVQRYDVFRSTVSGIYGAPIAALPAGVASYRDTTTTDDILYFYRLDAVGGLLRSLPSEEAGPVSSFPNEPAGVSGENAAVARGRLIGVSGNPFRRATTVRFELARPGPVELSIYSVTGQRARVVSIPGLAAGRHTIVWDGTVEQGHQAVSGVYMARLVGPGFEVTFKLLKLD